MLLCSILRNTLSMSLDLISVIGRFHPTGFDIKFNIMFLFNNFKLNYLPYPLIILLPFKSTFL